MADIPANRDALILLIEQRRLEIKRAGALHKRDLLKNLHRLERELRDYDRFRKEAMQNG